MLLYDDDSDRFSVLCCRRVDATNNVRCVENLPRVILRDSVRAVLILHVLPSHWKTPYRYGSVARLDIVRII